MLHFKQLRKKLKQARVIQKVNDIQQQAYNLSRCRCS